MGLIKKEERYMKDGKQTSNRFILNRNDKKTLGHKINTQYYQTYTKRLTKISINGGICILEEMDQKKSI